MRQCEVYLHGIKAGMLTEEDNGEYTFIYDSSYLEKGDCPSVSLTLPLREEPYRSTVLFPFFFNMLSEGENRKCNLGYCTSMLKMTLAYCWPPPAMIP